MATRRASQSPSEGGRKNERRKALRLRFLIDQFHARIQQNRHDLDVQFTRLAQIQSELDLLHQAASRSARETGQTMSKRRG